MEKKIAEARLVDEKGLYVVEVRAYELSTRENIKLRDKLEERYENVVFTYIDADSFECEIKDITYNDIKELEGEGWEF